MWSPNEASVINFLLQILQFKDNSLLPPYENACYYNSESLEEDEDVLFSE